MDHPQGLYEQGKSLCEIGALLPGGVTVGEAFDQWKKTDPEKHHQLAVLLARLALERKF